MQALLRSNLYAANALSNTDILVFGAGIFGLSVAFACLRRGASVRIVDPRGLAAGASGGVVGALAPHAPERWNAIKAFQFRALILSEAYWREIAEISGEDPGYARTGRLQPIPDAAALARAEERAQHAAEFWQGQASWRLVPSESWQDWAPASPTGHLIEDTLSARLHPRQTCRSLAAAVTVLGGEHLSEPPATNRPVIWATGWEGLTELGRDLGREIGRGVKGQAALLAGGRPDHPQIYAEGVHIVPHKDGTIAVGSTSEREFDAPEKTDEQLEALLQRARILCPAIATLPVVERWAGIRPRCRTRQPLLGPHPMKPGHYIANGGFKIGFALAPLVGEVMADLVLEGRDTRPEPFRIEAAL